jgi:hypothetical protein
LTIDIQLHSLDTVFKTRVKLIMIPEKYNSII